MNAPMPQFDPAAESGAAVVSFDAGGRPYGPAPRTYRRRRRGQREADKALHNHQTDRWMVSYADFITLLFAFFVVMYAMSSVNEGRYRVLSGALSTAFSPDGRTNPGNPAAVPHLPVVAPANLSSAVPAPPDATTTNTATAAVSAPAAGRSKPTVVPEMPVDPVERAELERIAVRAEHMQQLATRLDEHLQALVRDGQVQVTRGARGIAIEINAAVLFDPARAELRPASFAALRSLAQVIAGFVEPLQIEGHSDDVPIATREFKSNWELSAARAASVGRFLIDQGIAPGRIGIAGYAEFRPLVGNADSATRARNRRVTLVVLSADDTRPQDASTRPASTPATASSPAPALSTADGAAALP